MFRGNSILKNKLKSKLKNILLNHYYGTTDELQVVEDNIGNHYFEIKENGNELVFQLKNFLPYFEESLIIKNRKTGKRLSIPFKKSKAVLTASELDEIDELGYYNVFLKVFVNGETFLERSKYHHQNGGKKLLNLKNGKIAEFYPTINYNLSFKYKEAPYQAELSSIKLNNGLLELDGIVNLLQDIDFDRMEFLIFSDTKGRAFPCEYEASGNNKLNFKSFINFDFNEKLLNTSWDTKIRLIKDDIVIYNANLKTYKLFDSYNNEDKIFEAVKSDEKNISEVFYTDNQFNLKLDIISKEKSKNLMELAKGEDIYNHHSKNLEIDDNLVFFESFNGLYAHNPKYIYEKMLELGYGEKYKFVWNLKDKNTEIPGNPIIVGNRDEEYYKYLSKAKYWINNTSFPRLYKKGHEYLQTWHGTPYKKLSYDVDENDEIYLDEFIEESHNWDCLITSNSYSTKTLKESLNFKNKILESGYPANDVFYTKNQAFKDSLKDKLNIPKDKKIVLYAPTYRKEAVVLDVKKLHDNLNEDFIFIIKNHPNNFESLETDINDFVMDLSSHDDIHELYLISDILITDYSSVSFDFAHGRKPILFYVPDIEAYLAENLLFKEIRGDFPGPQFTNVDELIDSIKNIDEISENYKEKYEIFYNKYCSIGHGSASEEIIKAVFDDGGLK